MDNYHSQCRFSKWGFKYQAWIPTKFAVKGNFVKLKIDGAWDDGWLVEEVFNSLPSSYVNERSQDYKKTRQASDI